MREKMCLCKACDHEIAKSAKTCPYCGARNKKKHPILVGLLVFIILISVFGASAESDEPMLVGRNEYTPVETVNNAEGSGTNDNFFRTGEVAELNQVVVSMVNVSESTGSAYNTPTDGNVFVLCEFEIANNSDQEISVSSMLSFEAYCDDYTCTYSLAATLEKGNKNQLDGTVAPGKKFNGVIGYEVPTSWQKLEVHFTPDFWDGKDIVFIAEKP